LDSIDIYTLKKHLSRNVLKKTIENLYRNPMSFIHSYKPTYSTNIR